MTISTRIILAVLFMGVLVPLFYKQYEAAYQLFLVILLVLLVWYNEKNN